MIASIANANLQRAESFFLHSSKLRYLLYVGMVVIGTMVAVSAVWEFQRSEAQVALGLVVVFASTALAWPVFAAATTGLTAAIRWLSRAEVRGRKKIKLKAKMRRLRRHEQPKSASATLRLPQFFLSTTRKRNAIEYIEKIVKGLPAKKVSETLGILYLDFGVFLAENREYAAAEEAFELALLSGVGVRRPYAILLISHFKLYRDAPYDTVMILRNELRALNGAWPATILALYFNDAIEALPGWLAERHYAYDKTPQSVLEDAVLIEGKGDRGARCEAWFYLALWYLRRDDQSRAAMCFEECISQCDEGLESKLARALMRQL